MFVHAAVYVNTIHGDNPVCARVCMSLDLIIAMCRSRSGRKFITLFVHSISAYDSNVCE